MIADIILAILHFIFVFIVVGILSAELILMRLAPSAPVVRTLARIDLLYGASAVGVLAAGLGRVFFGLKDASYYLGNHAFWGKIAVFVIIGLISILPTLRFINWRNALAKDETALPTEAQWKSVRRWVTIQAHLLVLIIVFAVIMARIG